MSSPTLKLLKSDLFKSIPEHLTNDERIELSYHRAYAVAKAYGLEASDILNLTPKFWQIHQDMTLSLDGAAFFLISLQYNIAGATFAMFVTDQPGYQPLLDRILKFDVSMQFMLTEVGHGLDARNLETTATLLPSGDFDIHTPNSNAAKFTPPNWPRKGFPQVALVFAQLLVSGDDWGVRPFVVWLNDGKNMCEGVTAKLLPKRAGSKPLDHAITIFSHVRLPRSALLGPLKKPNNMQESFLSMTRRSTVGSLAATTALIPQMKRAVFVAGKYSLRRRIMRQNSKPVPIISFRTQQLPILHALAQIAVFDPFAQDSIQQFKRSNSTPAIQQVISATFKAVLCQASQPMFHALSERCGAQGLWDYNQIIGPQLETRFVSIAERDILALSIKIGTELLLNRYQPPSPTNPTCLLAQHEKGLFDESRSILNGLQGGHHHAEFNSLILPRCPALIEAIGHRRAYEAAAKAGVDSDLLALYEIHAVLLDLSWYVQHTDITREYIFQKEARLLDTLLPRLDTLLDATGAGPYCTAPILSQASWDAFVDGLETLGAVNMTKDKARL
ncbi:acyl-CoA oxidase [Aspergillus nomiae NRRL 13137]|uniref:Acyl-CoA oxidase n=1 Tax=Aspergillus nomiae NRRL (strain ATCC 15546 / NRRL 13137 / CBS 260.88 / M93) TaxID=1509407 RepID=A0A0L1JDN1_ASPN3|nr:acyl-CoA oxidase [Aspergillus nomiae NRRL 13137]KNG89822.1 acyl-CoA oxidase [Aspergillus nomiae NRRL 13137]